MAEFLVKQKKSDFYYARLDVPKDLQQHYGKKVLKKSLRTKDIREAKALSNYYLAEWRTDFQRVRNQWSVESGDTRSIPSKYLDQLQPKIDQWKTELFEQARSLHEITRHSTDTKAVKEANAALAKLQADYKAKYGDTAEIPPGEWERQLERSLTHKTQNPGKLVALPTNETGPISSLIEDIAQGRIVPKSDLFREQLRKNFSAFQKDHVEEKTHDMRLGALKEIATYFQKNKLNLDKDGVTQYLQSIKSQALTTKKRKLAAGKLYFDYLRDEGLVSENAANPFSNHKFESPRVC